MAESSYDRAIRDLYLESARLPLRVALNTGGYPPYLKRGDVVQLERSGLGGAKPGEFVGVRRPGEDVWLGRFLRRRGEDAQILMPARIESVPAAEVVGPARSLLRQGRRLELSTAQSVGSLALEALGSRGRSLGRHLHLVRELAGLYWDLVESFETGVSELGDLLVTERCPVGCRFCIYSCVTTGQDMEVELVRQAARAFREAGIPRVRLLGGEPFVSVPHLVQCFRAVRESYPGDRIIILTSGYFGTREERVRDNLDPLLAEGFTQLHLSFDAFHLERYPVSCYERVLDYARERSLEAALVVHYSAGLAADLATLLRLRERCPFRVRITTVSREGDAAALSGSETSLAGFEEFRDVVLDAPGIELIREEASCFRWTVFPSGDVHFCCKENEKNRVGNLRRDSLPELQARLRSLTARNRMNVLRFAACHSKGAGTNACLTCPLEAGA